MKQIITLVSVALAAITVGCTKESIGNGAASHPMKVNISCDSPETKTMIQESAGQYIPSWKSTDKLGVYTLVSSTENNTNKQFSVAGLSEGKASSFTGSIDNTGAGTYQFLGYYPYTAGQLASSVHAVSLTLPANQSPTQTSFDGDADILVAKPVDKAIAADQESVSDLNFQFARLVSILKIKITHVDNAVAEEEVKSVRLSAPDYILSGSFSLDLSTGETSSWSGADYAQANYSTIHEEVNNFVSWINVHPVTIASGMTITVKVVTSNHIIQKTITLSSDLALKEGKIISLEVNMAGCQVNPTPSTPLGAKLLGVALASDSDGFNMLSDGGFENQPGQSCGVWKDHTLWYIPDYVWAYDDSGMRSGNRSLFADLNTHDWRDVVVQTVALKKNTSYTFSIDMQKAWADAGVYFGFRAAATHDFNTNGTETANWKTYSYDWGDIDDVQANMFVGAWPWDNFWIRLDNMKLIPTGYTTASYKPSTTTVESGFANNTFQSLDGCLRMVTWPIGNPATSTSYRVAMAHATIDGNLFESAAAHATVSSTGLVIDNFKGNGKEMLTGAEAQYCVPTSGFSNSLGTIEYVFYYATNDDWVSANDWAAVGCYVAKSTNEGSSWQKVDALTKGASSKFVNACALTVGSDVYIFGSPAGRGGVNTYVAKVAISSFEDASAWRYFDGSSFGATTEEGAVSIFYGPTAEMSVCYDSETSLYVAFYRSLRTGKLVYRESTSPEGLWSGEKEAVDDPTGAYYFAPSIVKYTTESDTNGKIFMLSSSVENGYSLGGIL